MKIKIKIQVGAYHKPQDDPDRDFRRLLQTPEDLLEWVMEDLEHHFKVGKVWRMADGTPHLIEFEAETFIE